MMVEAQQDEPCDSRASVCDSRSHEVGPSRLLLFFLGWLLLAAALLKVHGAGVEPIRESGWLAHAGIRVAVVLLEVFLGIWFLSGREQGLAWLCALGVFFCFAIVSFRQGWVGEVSCGCFGQITVSPWVTFGIDVGLVALLLVARPARDELQALPRTIQSVLWPALGMASCFTVFSAALIGYALWAYGSLDAAVAALRGEPVSVKPSLVDLASGPPGESISAEVSLINWTDNTGSVYGGTSDCSCSVVADLPIRIQPGERKVIHVRVQRPNDIGRFTRAVRVLTSFPEARVVSFRITGQTLKAKSEVADGR